MAEQSSRDQNITIQVMRLAKAIPNVTTSPICGPSDVSCLNSGNQFIDLPTGQFPIVPHMTSDVFLGECFTFYVAIINTTLLKCERINIKVDIQAQLQRISIAEASFGSASLMQNQQIGKIFSHEICEHGQHILVCTVSYIGSNNEELTLKKLFKFSANKPFDLINQTFHDLNDRTTFFVLQLRNLMSQPIFIDSLTLENADQKLAYQCELISLPSFDINFKPLDVRSIHQYIFRLTLDDQNDIENWWKILNFGKLKIIWRSSTGDDGRTYLNIVERSPSVCKDLNLTVEKAPKLTKANELITIVCNLRNLSNRPMDLLLELDQNIGSIIHCSVSGQRLPTILPGHSMQIVLDLLPYLKGLHVSGIKLTDTVLKRTFEFDDLFHIFIQ